MWGEAGFYTERVSDVSLLFRDAKLQDLIIMGEESGVTYGGVFAPF